MSVTAKLSYLRIAPRKVRIVADLVRRKSVEEAQTILNFTTKKAAPILLKLLKQAVANAKTSFQLEEKNLYISKILINEGSKYKRWRPRARGMAAPIQKRTSHVTIVLDEVVKKPKKTKKLKKAEEVRPEPVEKKEVKEAPKTEKPKPKPEREERKPVIEKGKSASWRRIFRRKAF
jgi:large subunit ribosomal protein L22